MRTARTSVLMLLVMPALVACSSSPAASAPASTSAAASIPPSGNVQISARTLRFEQVAVEIPAGQAFKIDFDNKDAATVHDIDIHRDDFNGEVVFDGATIAGPALTTYDVPALPAGTYAFMCSVHPGDMRGTMNAK